MQEGNRYQLQTALKMLKNIQYILKPMALELSQKTRSEANVQNVMPLHRNGDSFVFCGV